MPASNTDYVRIVIINLLVFNSSIFPLRKILTFVKSYFRLSNWLSFFYYSYISSLFVLAKDFNENITQSIEKLSKKNACVWYRNEVKLKASLNFTSFKSSLFITNFKFLRVKLTILYNENNVTKCPSMYTCY